MKNPPASSHQPWIGIRSYIIHCFPPILNPKVLKGTNTPPSVELSSLKQGKGIMQSSKAFTGAQLQLRPQVAAAQRARVRLGVFNKLVLVPTGDGSTAHIGQDVQIPGRLELQAGKLYELGRAEPADLIIPIPTVSGRHAIVRVDIDNTVTVTDLQSTNGTYVDGQELQPMKAAQLLTGSEITFGDGFLAKYRLVDEEDPVPEAAAAAEN